MKVRSITDAELPAYLQSVGTGFLFETEPSEASVEFWRTVYGGEFERRLGAFVDGGLRGTTGSFGAELTVPGGATIPMGAVTQVTVLPTHRRRGLLTAMMRTQLEDSIARGEIAAMLIAAEWPIYGRFGYGMAVEAAGTVIDARNAAFTTPIDANVELVGKEAIRDIVPAVFDAHRVTSPGAIDRPPVWWDMFSGRLERPNDGHPKNRTYIVHRDQRGKPDGYAVYDTNENWQHNRPEVTLSIRELIHASPAAYRNLWRFLCEIDWITEVRGHVRPVDEDLRPLLVDGRVTRQVDRNDHMWVRLLDVPAAMSARAYEAEASVVIEVTDPFLDRGGRFKLDVGPDGASCKPARRSPDLSLGVDVLGATYLGGSSLRMYELAGRVEEHRRGTLARLDRALRTARAPWATTSF
jgi:predicted acetyltransferase